MPDPPLRARHVAFFVRQIERGGKVNGDLDPDLERELATLAEGVPVLHNHDCDPQPSAPSLARPMVERWLSQSVASWQNEVMLVSNDITLIYSPDADRVHCIFNQRLEYYKYWMTILRGIAMLCELRMLAQQLRNETADLLQQLILKKSGSDLLARRTRQYSWLLARLRTASDATTIAPGDYAAHKFEKVAEVFSIPEIVEAVQKNIELSNADLSHNESLELERSQFALNVGLGLVAPLTLILALPSFWESSSKVAVRKPDSTAEAKNECYVDCPDHIDILPRSLQEQVPVLSQETTELTLLGIVAGLLIMFILLMRRWVRRWSDPFATLAKLYRSTRRCFNRLLFLAGRARRRWIGRDDAYLFLREALGGPAGELGDLRLRPFGSRALAVQRLADCPRTGAPVLRLERRDDPAKAPPAPLELRLREPEAADDPLAELNRTYQPARSGGPANRRARLLALPDNPFESRVYSPSLEIDETKTLEAWLSDLRAHRYDGLHGPARRLLAAFGRGSGAGEWNNRFDLRFACDLDGKGGADLVGIRHDGLWVSLNRGKGRFEPPQLVLHEFGHDPYRWFGKQHPRFLAAVEGPGRLDLVGFGKEGVFIAPGDPTRIFEKPIEVLSAVDFGKPDWYRGEQHPHLADLQGQGRLDIVLFNEKGCLVAFNRGGYRFDKPRQIDIPWKGSRPLHPECPRFLADLDGSGRADIIAFEDNGVWIVTNIGGGDFGAPCLAVEDFGLQQGRWEMTRHLRRPARLTRSDRIDLLGFGHSGVLVSLNQTGGKFANPKVATRHFGFASGFRVDRHARCLGDTTGDGLDDIVAFGNRGVWISRNRGNGTFEEPILTAHAFGNWTGLWDPENPRLLADLNGDGRVDLVGFGHSGVWASFAR